MSNLTFLHFDTTLRDNKNADPFSSTFTLANPLKKIKKIYLKSVEMPIGFYNIRQNYIFSFVITIPNINIQPNVTIQQVSGISGGTIGQPIDGGPIITGPISFQPYLQTVNLPSNYFGSTGSIQSSQLSNNSFQFTINVVPGNYTIDTLITYINNGLATLYNNLFQQLNLTSKLQWI
jgi:hypothetical protein